MPCIEKVITAFVLLGKTGDAIQLAQRAELLATASQQFPGIDLVPDIKDDLVSVKIEGQKQGHRQLDNTQIGCQMAAVLRDRRDNRLPDFSRQLFEFGFTQVFQLLRMVDFFQNRCHIKTS